MAPEKLKANGRLAALMAAMRAQQRSLWVSGELVTWTGGRARNSRATQPVALPTSESVSKRTPPASVVEPARISSAPSAHMPNVGGATPAPANFRHESGRDDAGEATSPVGE